MSCTPASVTQLLPFLSSSIQLFFNSVFWGFLHTGLLNSYIPFSVSPHKTSLLSGNSFNADLQGIPPLSPCHLPCVVHERLSLLWQWAQSCPPAMERLSPPLSSSLMLVVILSLNNKLLLPVGFTGVHPRFHVSFHCINQII